MTSFRDFPSFSDPNISNLQFFKGMELKTGMNKKKKVFIKTEVGHFIQV